jgi:MYXO-CTERM domain-containing protein
MTKIHLTVGVVVLAFAGAANAATYYVAPTGSDSAGGTLAAPWATIAHAQSVAAAGDTIYFRGGTYAFTAAQSACGSSSSTVNGVLLNKSGASGSPINYWANPGEIPVFDFSGIKDACRITGFQVTGSWLYFKGLTVTGVPQNINTNHESWGIYVNGGNNNIFEQLNLHHNMGPGLFIIRGGNNHVINCDSHENYDPNSGSAAAPSGDAGGNADGFGFHSTSAADAGTLFSGCRAWLNSDDGWDFIEAASVVTLENSWSWYNGYIGAPPTTTAEGNGNGFKAGGYDLVAANVPPVVPQHHIHNCLAVLNKANGFYENHHAAADFFYNNTSYGNHADFNLQGVAADGVTTLDLGILRNNIAFTGILLSNNTGSGVDDAFNSWDATLGVTVSDADFQSVSVTGLDSPRQADGSLPDLPNFHLAAGSKLIDKGTDVGLPFAGAAPDLGAFETGLVAAGGSNGTGGAGGGTGGTSGATGGSVVAAGGSGFGGSRGGAGGTLSPPAGGSKAGTGGNAGTGGVPSSGGSVGAGGEAGGNTGTSGSGGVAGSSSGATAGSSTSSPAGAGGAIASEGGASSGGLGSGGSSGSAGGTSTTSSSSSGCGCDVGGKSLPTGLGLAPLLGLAGLIAGRRAVRRNR